MAKANVLNTRTIAYLEQAAAGRACDPDTDPGTIEHVLPEHWTPELLDTRQAHLAARAAHLWRADFP